MAKSEVETVDSIKVSWNDMFLFRCELWVPLPAKKLFQSVVNPNTVTVGDIRVASGESGNRLERDIVDTSHGSGLKTFSSASHDSASYSLLASPT